MVSRLPIHTLQPSYHLSNRSPLSLSTKPLTHHLNHLQKPSFKLQIRHFVHQSISYIVSSTQNTNQTSIIIYHQTQNQVQAFNQVKKVVNMWNITFWVFWGRPVGSSKFFILALGLQGPKYIIKTLLKSAATAGLERSSLRPWALKLFLAHLQIASCFDDGSWFSFFLVCVSCYYCAYDLNPSLSSIYKHFLY